jgi:hypothetical protein
VPAQSPLSSAFMVKKVLNTHFGLGPHLTITGIFFSSLMLNVEA